MAQKKAYSRYFIILQQDENGYSLASDKLPSGYTKLETKNDKCKISYYVQNLKKEMEPYYMVLICNKKDVKKLIKLGTMNIDDYGRAEITYEYGVDNVAGSNIPVDMIAGAAVVKIADSKVLSVMSGFSTTDVPADWKAYVISEMPREADISDKQVPEQAAKAQDVQTEEQVEVKQEIKEELREEKNIFDEYEQKIEEAKLQADTVKENVEVEVQARNDADPEVEARVDSMEGPAEDVPVEENKVIENEIPEQIEVNQDDTRDKDKHKDDKCKEKEKPKEKCPYPSGTVGDFFKAIAEEFEELEDACKEIKRCRWYKVPVKSLDDLCNQTNYNKYTIVYYPMISYYPYIKKHGHYLLGYKYDASGKMKYLVYGIPGTKSKVEQPYGGKSGFVTWVPLKPGEERDGDMGYWLMFYDFRTSTIVIPMK